MRCDSCLLQALVVPAQVCVCVCVCERVTHLFKHTERVQKATGKASENSRKDMVSASAIRVRCRAETAKTLEPSPVHELHGQDMVYSTLYIVGSKPYQSPVLFAPPSHTACSNGSRRCLLHCLRLRRITLSSITHLSTAGSVKAKMSHACYLSLSGGLRVLWDAHFARQSLALVSDTTDLETNS